jgi:hypothetical protein
MRSYTVRVYRVLQDRLLQSLHSYSTKRKAQSSPTKRRTSPKNELRNRPHCRDSKYGGFVKNLEFFRFSRFFVDSLKYAR